MKSVTLPKKLIQASLFSTLGILALGTQSASAITFGIGNTIIERDGSNNGYGYGCNNLSSNILGCYGFNRFDNEASWLTLENGDRWAIKGTIIAANATLSNTATGTSSAARVLTLTNATFEYKNNIKDGTLTSGTLSNLTFSHLFDFTSTITTTTGETRTILFKDPTVSHRLSGTLSATSATNPLKETDGIQSSVAFTGQGNTISRTNLSESETRTLSSNLALNSLNSGSPDGKPEYSFLQGKDETLTGFFLKSGTLSATVNSITLAKGSSLYLPASECTVIHDGYDNGDDDSDNTSGTNPGNNKPVGNAFQEPNNGSFVDGVTGNSGVTGTNPLTQPESQSGTVSASGGNSGGNSGGAGSITTPDNVEELCNRVARSVVGVPEPHGALPVLGSVLLWGAGSLIRRKRDL